MYMGRICWCGRVLLQNLHAPFDGDRRPSKRCLQPCTVVLLALQSDPTDRQWSTLLFVVGKYPGAHQLPKTNQDLIG